MWRRQKRTEDRLDTELRYHFDRLVRDLIAEGIDPAEARRRARLEFGGIEQVKDDCRDVRGHWLQDFAKDLRYTARTFQRSPGFVTVAVLSLALGIGANTAIFSLIEAVMLRMLPVSHPEQLMFANTNAVVVSSGAFRISQSIGYGALESMQRSAQSVAGLCSVREPVQVAVAWNGKTDLAAGQFVSANFFTLLGVPAWLGRTFGAEDRNPESRLAVLGFAYWQRRFGGDPGVIGRSLIVNNVPFTIAAVTPREFYGASLDAAADITMPQATWPQVQSGRMSSNPPKPADSTGRIFVRMKAGVPVSQAAAELTTLLHQAVPDSAKSWVELTPASLGFSRIRNRFAQPLEILMAVAGLVMLIACANIANLLLARAGARRREIAIRLSLGSTRWRLVRQFLTESLCLSVLGGILGLVLAMWARDGIVSLAHLNAAIPAGWNLRVLAFLGGTCILSVLLFGTAPALSATGIDLAGALKTSRSGNAAARLPLARILVAAQVALSLALLVGAALFLGTFRNLDRVDLGYDRGHSLVVTIDPSYAGYKGAAATEIYRQILERVAALPGVRGASYMEQRLMTGQVTMSSVFVPGYTLRPDEDPANLWVFSQQVGPEFFRVSGMHLAAGREFSDGDHAGAAKVAIVNQSMAEHFFAGKDPIGRPIAWDREETPMTVVGVVRDIRFFGVREDKEDLIFTPILQTESKVSATLWVRTAADPAGLAAAVRGAVRSVDPKLPLFDISTVDQQVASSLSQPRLLAVLGSAFGVLALLLATVGLYGVISYGVARRTSEIGVRMALGAGRGTIRRLILGETARLVAIGLVIGIAGAVAGTRAVAGMLYGITPGEVWPIAGAAAVLAAASLLAAILPAQRASRVEPTVALRHE